MAYMSGPTFMRRNGEPTRADFVAAIKDLEGELPGYHFCCDRSVEGGIRMLNYPGYQAAVDDVTRMQCIIRRAMLNKCCFSVMRLIHEYIGPVCYGFADMGRNSPYKALRMHGLNWTLVSGAQELERTLWQHDTTPIVRGRAVYTTLKAFRGAPKWTAHELETICGALHRNLGLVPEWWSSRRPNYITGALRAKLLKDSFRGR